MAKVIGIAVTYYPDAKIFGALLERLLAQVALVVVIDNTPTEANWPLAQVFETVVAHDRCKVIRLGANSGIAHAINVGVSVALADGAEFVVLSDQDSLPNFGMVDGLCNAYADLTGQGVPVGGIGPTFTDMHTMLTYPFQTELPGKFFYGHKAPSFHEPHVEALTLITSGTLIPVEVIRRVGPMREDFFIDHVDIEWSHRARAMGYRLFGTGWARMYQRMGEERLRVWYLKWRYESAYHPLRIYYRVRNFTALCKLDFIEWRWKLRSSWYWLGILYAHLIFRGHRIKTFEMACKGLWHGLVGRMGPYPGRVRTSVDSR